ncbi:MAG: plasmid stabilization protein [Rhodomicrobium sp.]|nr:plasmid stabilization protein [Rhodomicrobium sp.]
MTSIIIPNVDDTLKRRLQARAEKHGKSVEAEARDILREAVGWGEPELHPKNLYAAIRSIVEPLGGIDFELPPREPVREPPRFE